jgi:hypothetical protein
MKPLWIFLACMSFTFSVFAGRCGLVAPNGIHGLFVGDGIKWGIAIDDQLVERLSSAGNEIERTMKHASEARLGLFEFEVNYIYATCSYLQKRTCFAFLERESAEAAIQNLLTSGHCN